MSLLITISLVTLLGVGSADAAATDLPPGGTFVDEDGNLHEGDIEAIAETGITRGCDARGIRYCPARPVSRGEMAVFLVRARGADENAPGYGGEFADVPADAWYASSVGQLAEQGITKGCGAGRFCPEDPVTRAQMASLLVRAFLLPPSDEDAFDDDQASIHERDIDALKAAGVTNGCSPERFCPEEVVKRDQLASFLSRAGHLTPRTPPPFQGQIGLIDSGVRDRLVHSWRPGCPVPLDALRYLTVDHWGFDGQVHRGELIVHQEHAAGVLSVLRSLFALGFPIERMELVDEYGGDDIASMEANNSSAFNCRSVVGRPGVWSEHANGAAIDLNPVQNPFIRNGEVLPESGAAYVDRSVPHPALIPDGGAVVEEFGRIGWSWGGIWTSSKDYMHFSSAGR